MRRTLLTGIQMGPSALETPGTVEWNKSRERERAAKETRDPASTQARDPATAQTRDEIPEADARAGYKTRTRIEKPHVSLYANPETFDAVKRLALDNRTTSQAIFRRGLLLALQEQGLYLDKTEADI